MKMKRLIAVVLLLVTVFTVFPACGECEHTFVGGACSKCGVADPDFVPICAHKFVDGVCSECGEADPDFVPACTHEFANGVCGKCGEKCSHEYADGVCTVCGLGCSHSYTDGVCTVCGLTCTHSYTDGVCTVCGEKAPVPADGGASLYAPVISKFKELILYKYTYEELPPKENGQPAYVDALFEVGAEYSPEKDMGYALRDINGDGWVELVLMERNCYVYALFTIIDGAPVTVHVFQQGMGFLKSDGTVFYNEKTLDQNGGQIFISYNVTRLVNGKLVGFAYGREDADGNYATDDDIYYHTVNGEKIVIEKDAYSVYTDKYDYFWDYPSRLTRLVGLYYQPALPAQILDVPTVNFSTYDEIIKTFGVMYFDMAYNSLKGKSQFDKSKWTGGAYEMLMKFGSDGDYYIFNRLVAACVLCQNSSSAVFGYALRDLDGDGSDELILMENKGYILAVFTQRDGKALLLDSYTDLRNAWIDGSNRIHVQERTLPGNKADALYTVYELKNGALTPVLSIGCTCVKDGYKNVQAGWYKIENGVKTDMTQESWELLYAEWELDLGTAKFYTYNIEKAGLVFVALAEM